VSAPEFAKNNEAFAELVAEIQHQLDVGVRLPEWPFLARSGFVTIYEYDRLLGGAFGSVVQALAGHYGDRTVAVVGVDPPVAYYRDAYGFLPGFRMAADFVEEQYAAGLRHEPGGDPTGALAFTVNVIGMAGSSRAWSAWGQRNWEIGLLLTSESQGPWLEQAVPWFSRDVDLDSIRSPEDGGRLSESISVRRSGGTSENGVPARSENEWANLIVKDGPVWLVRGSRLLASRGLFEGSRVSGLCAGGCEPAGAKKPLPQLLPA
jgi:hypothetical protein